MAVLKLYKDRLAHNYRFLDEKFREHDVAWGVVTKMLCGNDVFLKEVLELGAKEIHDSRVSNLKTIKELDPEVQTVYIKPPPKRSIHSIVKFADVSFNTEYDTIKLLSDEAQNQGKIHKIIIMIELGDLREGVMGEELVDFYARVFELPAVEIIGLGANLNCLHGVMPNQDKLIQLSLYKQIIELKFGRRIPWISGGTSVTLPLMFQNRLPKGVNHFRLGETLFFGKNLISGKTIKGMYDDVFELFAEIIEVTHKPVLPTGELGENVMGETFEFDEEGEEADYSERSYRAIVDVGTLDIVPKFLIPKNEENEVVGASSDMLVVDLGDNKRGYKVGDWLRFKLKYMGALHLQNSDYINKRVETSPASKSLQNGKAHSDQEAPTSSKTQPTKTENQSA